MSTIGVSVDIISPSEKLLENLKKTESKTLECLIENEAFIRNELKLYFELDIWNDDLNGEDIFEEVIDLLEGKAFVMVSQENYSTNDAETWVYLGTKDKEGPYVTHHEVGATPERNDDFCDNKIGLKEVFEEWGVSYRRCDPEVLRLIGIYDANYEPKGRYIPQEYKNYFSTAKDLKGFVIEGKRIAPTGDFYYDRKDIEKFIEREGGTVARNISGNTALVIIGLENEYARESKKLKYAVEYKQKGKPIIIVSDIEFQKWRVQQMICQEFGNYVTEPKKSVLFGKYPQNSKDCAIKQDIEWLVLEETKDSMLLISKYILDNRVYDSENAYWDDSDIREWLNTEFMYKAFSKEEQEEILITKRKQESPNACRYSGESEEKIFLLSEKELKKYFDIYESEEKSKKTTFAISKGLESSIGRTLKESPYEDLEKKASEETFGAWCLRTSHYNNEVVYVSEEGYYEDTEDKDMEYGVRPALWKKIIR